ncbi:PAS domain-containing protein [Yunchengibacter salinarum]|uniref:PAS domain-containing protein n=1 Tax=Yunchengibacter salinarum TaxID=3133399 RepID=UPI0035B6300E
MDLPLLVDLLELWHEKRGNALLPARSAFSHHDFKRWLGNLCIVQVENHGADYVLALIGTHVARYHRDQDFTGQKVGEAPFGLHRDAVRDVLDSAVANRTPQYETLASEDHPGTSRRLVLPCAEDHETVDRLIVAIYPDKALLDSLDPEPLFSLYS